jgi:sugar phosphate isomerase/epimerase
VEAAGFGKFTAAQFRGLLDAAGLKCPSAHLPLTGDDLSRPLADANTLGAHFATSSVLRTFDFGGVRPTAGGLAKMPPLPPLGLDGFKAIAEHMNRVGRQVHDAGLQYAYHNHNFEFEKMPDGSYGYDLLVKGTDPELVKFEVDCGWMVVAGANPVEYFRNYPGRFRMLHVKDFKRPPQPTVALIGPNRPEGTPPGEGFIDYGPIFAAARDAGIEHVFAEEEAPYPGSQLDAAKLNYAFLERFH